MLDLETTGLDPERHRIVQVGLVIADASGTVLDRWMSYVGPGLAVWRGVGPSHVHGIRRRDVWRAPRAGAVLTELAGRLAGTRVVAHNAAFDLTFLRIAARQHHVALDLPHPLCTLQLSRALDPERSQSHRLGDLCTRYGIELRRAHDALADAEATAALLPHLLRAHGVADVDQLAALPPAS